MNLQTKENIKSLIWLAFHDRLPSKTLIYHRELSTSAICNRCNLQEEYFFHSLRDYTLDQKIWNEVWFYSSCQAEGFKYCETLKDWIMIIASSDKACLFLASL